METIPCNQLTVIVGHLVYQNRSLNELRIHAFQIHDFVVAIHLVVILLTI